MTARHVRLPENFLAGTLYTSFLPRPTKLNRRLLDRVDARRRLFLSGTLLHGVFALRIAVLCVRTYAERVDEALDDIQAALAEV